MYDSVIIGSGPAGLTAAIYLSRAGLKNVIISGAMPGGQLTSTTDIENFPGFPKGISGFQLMEDMALQAANFGTETLNTTVVSIDFDSKPFKIHLKNKDTLEARSIILSTGSTAKYLGIENEIESIGNGVSACATCDGFFYRKKVVAVVGGGDTACEEATYLAGLCSKVYMIVRKPYLRASEVMKKRVEENEKIEILYEHNTLGLYGENGLEGAHLVKRKGEADEQKYDLPIDGFFLAIGHKPNTDVFKDWLDLDEVGYIKTINGTPRTQIAGVFAAGDCADRVYRQAVVAAGSGCKAALEAERYLAEINK